VIRSAFHLHERDNMSLTPTAIELAHSLSS